MPQKYYDIFALLLRFWFIFIVLLVTIKAVKSTTRYMVPFNKQEEEISSEGVPLLISLFALSSFILLSFYSSIDQSVLDLHVILLGCLIICIFLFHYIMTVLVFRFSDRILLLLVNILCVIGFAMLQRLNPDLGLKQVEWYSLGVVVMLITALIMNYIKRLSILKYPLMIVALIILILPLKFGDTIGGAKNWFEFGKYNFQPSEFVKIILIFIMAVEFKDDKPTISRLPVLAFAGLCIALVVLQKDLGAAFIYFSLILIIYYIAASNLLFTIFIAVGGCTAAYISYLLFDHVKVRVQIWKNPWSDVEGVGYQLVQSLIAIGSGGLFGLGIGMGSPAVVPAAKTDFIFAGVCEEMGIIIGLCIIVIYALISIRGMTAALHSKNKFDSLMSTGASICLAVQSFIIIGGVIKMVPLTGVTLPFVSYGGSSMIVSFAFIGVIIGISNKNRRQMLTEGQEIEGETDDYENEEELEMTEDE